MIDGKKLWNKLADYKYPLLVLFLGVCILLIPSHSEKRENSEVPDNTLETVLAVSDGVGRVRVLLSDNGVVVVCDGADKAAVRLDILRAIGSYTGFGADRITVLKMSD